MVSSIKNNFECEWTNSIIALFRKNMYLRIPLERNVHDAYILYTLVSHSPVGPNTTVNEEFLPHMVT